MDKLELDFLRRQNEELMLELAVKNSENEVLLKLKYVLESVLKECDCNNVMYKKLLFKTLKLIRTYNILSNINIQNRSESKIFIICLYTYIYIYIN